MSEAMLRVAAAGGARDAAERRVIARAALIDEKTETDRDKDGTETRNGRRRCVSSCRSRVDARDRPRVGRAPRVRVRARGAARGGSQSGGRVGVARRVRVVGVARSDARRGVDRDVRGRLRADRDRRAAGARAEVGWRRRRRRDARRESPRGGAVVRVRDVAERRRRPGARDRARRRGAAFSHSFPFPRAGEGRRRRQRRVLLLVLDRSRGARGRGAVRRGDDGGGRDDVRDAAGGRSRVRARAESQRRDFDDDDNFDDFDDGRRRRRRDAARAADAPVLCAVRAVARGGDPSRDRVSGAFYLTLVPIRPRSARWTPILKDFSARRISPPAPRFQRPPSTPFNSN